MIPGRVADELVGHPVALELLCHQHRLLKGHIRIGVPVKQHGRGIGRGDVPQRFVRLVPVAVGRVVAANSARKPPAEPPATAMRSGSNENLDAASPRIHA